MKIEIKFSGSSLEAYARRVAALGTDGEIEMARGLNDAGDKVRTQVRRALKTQMGVISQGIVNAATSSRPAAPGRLEYQISATGKGLPIRDFPVSASVGSPVTALPWGVSHTFARSFMTSKRGLLRSRRGQARTPIQALFGPSPAKELVKDQSLETFEMAVPALVEPTIMARLVRLLP